RWADAFLACAESLPGVTVEKDTITLDGRTTTVGVHALGVDGPEMRARGAQDDVEDRLEGLRDWAGDCQVVVRIDRTELSKNIVRGLLAFREVLRRHEDVRGNVVHLVFAYP